MLYSRDDIYEAGGGLSEKKLTSTSILLDMAILSELEKQIDLINKRNRKVEQDKKWETSLTRRISLMIFTYLAIGLYLQAIEIDRPWINAIVPTIGFFLSTLTLPFFRQIWEKYFYKQ